MTDINHAPHAGILSVILLSSSAANPKPRTPKNVFSAGEDCLVRLRGNNNKKWKPQDDQQLLELLKAKATWPVIAATLKRRFSAVQTRAWRLKRSRVDDQREDRRDSSGGGGDAEMKYQR
jgi:hypothetical protein